VGDFGWPSGCTPLDRQLNAAGKIDDSVAKYAQLLFGDLNDTLKVRVDSVNEGSNFVTSKAHVNGIGNRVIAKYGFEKGTPGGDFGDSANAITLIKTRTPEAIEYITGVEYTLEVDSQGTCKEVNEYIYEQTRQLLTDEERARYDNEGKQLVFIDDTIDGEGGYWLPTDPYDLIEDKGTHLSIASASLVSSFDPAVEDNPENGDNLKDQYGVKYCKLISAQNMLIWMLDMAFDNSTTLMKSDPTPVLICEDMDTSVGSCYFYYPSAKTSFCQDYIGTDYTGGNAGTAKNQCENTRRGEYVDGVKCSDRTDIDDTIVGICAIQETEIGAYTWTIYEPDDENGCPKRFFTCE